MHLPTIPRPLFLLVVLFLALGGVYSVMTPIFEPPDEVYHYSFVQWLATGHGLPIQDPANLGPWEQEGGQPPLYYAVAAAATLWIDASDLPQRLTLNPYARIGIPLAFGNKNKVVHTSAEDFPWHNTTLAVHLLRLLSLLMAAGTVVITYFLMLELLKLDPHRDNQALPLAAAALVALNPMFLFIGASVNNDNLITLLASAILLLTVQLVTRGASAGRFIILGILAGLAALTKVSALALLALPGLTLLWLAWKSRSVTWAIRAGLAVGLPVIAIAGWWYARNYALYGDPLGLNVFLQIAGARKPVSILDLYPEFQGFRISFWGNFGQVNLIAADWVYRLFDLFTLLAAVGLLRRLIRGKGALLILPAFSLILVTISLIRYMMMIYAAQGRLIFPAISAVGVLLALGLEEFAGTVRTVFGKVRRSLTIHPAFVLAAVLLAFAVAAPFLIIAPAYALPLRLAGDVTVPNPVHIQFQADGRPELAGYELGRSVEPGAELPVTLYWRSAAPVPEDLYAYIHLFDKDGKLIGQWDALPGNGLYPTSHWKPGETIVDRYRVPVSLEAPPASIGRMEVGLTLVNSTVPVAAADPEGRELVPNVGRFKISSPSASSRLAPLYRFGDTLELLKLDVYLQRGTTKLKIGDPGENGMMTPLKSGDLLIGNLITRASRIPPRDYVLFVHLVDGEGHIASQWDKQPQQGNYPTSFWDESEEVRDTFSLQVPAEASIGDYHIELGYYSPESEERLPVIGSPGSGFRAVQDHIELAPLPVER